MLDPCYPPQDIDIALDNLLGREFADRINEYLKAHVRLVQLACCGIISWVARFTSVQSSNQHALPPP